MYVLVHVHVCISHAEFAWCICVFSVSLHTNGCQLGDVAGHSLWTNLSNHFTHTCTYIYIIYICRLCQLHAYAFFPPSSSLRDLPPSSAGIVFDNIEGSHIEYTLRLRHEVGERGSWLTRRTQPQFQPPGPRVTNKYEPSTGILERASSYNEGEISPIYCNCKGSCCCGHCI